MAAVVSAFVDLVLSPLLLLLVGQLVRISYAQNNDNQCVQTFERYFGYRLTQNVTQEHLLKNFSLPVGANVLKMCENACVGESNCQLFTIDVRRSECGIYGTVFDNEAKFLRTQIETDVDSIVWRKVCLQNVSSCSYSWRFDIAPEFTISADQIEDLRHVASIEQCQEVCSNEQTFACRSAMYNYVTRNCHLSKHDRRSSPKAFRKGTFQEVYLENHCVTHAEKDLDCDFTSEYGQAFNYGLVTVTADGLEACQKLCFHHADFSCRSYVYIAPTGFCTFGPDDRFVIDRYEFNNDLNTSGAYFQRNECTKVKVICGLDQMIANFRTDRAFDGRVMSVRSPNACNFDVKQQFEFNISFSLEQKDNCGLIDEEPHTVSAMVNIQYHDSVVTSKDRMMKFVCNYELTSQTVGNYVELEESNTTPNATIVNGGGDAPEAIMRIVNGAGETVTTAEIGQTLYAEVIMKQPVNNGTSADYTLFVTSCEALDDDNHVQLIDDAGCPTDSTLFEGFHPAQGSDNKILRAAFQGFRFQTKRRVNINCNVNFCYQFCQPALCSDKNGLKIMSFGRRRREAVPAGQLNGVFRRTNVHSGYDIIDGRMLVLSGETAAFVKTADLNVASFSSANLATIAGLATLLIVIVLAAIGYRVKRNSQNALATK